MKTKQPYKYRRLNCGPTSKQCGAVCISRDETCHKGKSALLKSNVQKEIKRLEEGKEPGSITNKAFAKLLIKDPDIGQKLPKEISPYIASSDKIDDRVKKTFFDSATRRSWNIDPSHGTRPAIKLKNQDETFASRINNRAIQHNVEAIDGDPKEFEKKSKGFFKTDKGKKVLKLIAGTAIVGATAALTAYAINESKKNKPGTPSVQDITEKSYQKSPDKTSAQEDIRESVRRSGKQTPTNSIGDSTYVTPTAAETYAGTYKSAERLERRIRRGMDLSDREKQDYKSYWGHEAGSRNNQPPTEDSRLGQAEKDVRAYIKTENPNATEEDIQKGLTYLRKKDAYDKARGNNMKYNPDTDSWEVKTRTNEKSDEEITFDKDFEGKKVAGRASSGGTSRDVFDNEYQSTPDSRRMKEKARADQSERANAAMQGNTDLTNEWQYDVASKNDPKTSTTILDDANAEFKQLPKKEQERQILDWDKLDDDKRKEFVDSEILREVRGTNYSQDIIDGVPSQRKRANNYIKNELYDIYRGDEGTLNVLRQQKLGQIQNALISGSPVLPAYQSDAESLDSKVTTDAGKKSEAEVDLIDTVLDDGIGTESGGKLTAKQRKQNDLAKIQPNIFKDVGKKYKKTGSGNITIITDAKGNKFKKVGEKIFFNGKEIKGEDLNDKLRKAWKSFNFAELDEDIFVRDIVEVYGNVAIVDTNEGILAISFSEENTMVIAL